MILLDQILYIAAFVLAALASVYTPSKVSLGWLALACFLLTFITPG